MTCLTGKALFDPWISDIRANTPAPTWACEDAIFQHIDVAPGRVILLAGPPGTGKTALLLQWVFGLLFANLLKLRIIVCNVEMSAQALLDRQLARLSGVPLTTINRRQIQPAEMGRIDLAASKIARIMDHLAFASDPYDLKAIATEASDFAADVLILDYIQRIRPSDRKKKADGVREQINLLMTELRAIANDGKRCVIAAAAVSRTRDKAGRNSYSGQHLTMASLRESSELEFGADDCLILCPTDDSANGPVRNMLLKHEKSRYGEPRDDTLRFERRFQRFESSSFEFAVPMRKASRARVATATTNGRVP
jgi:replicative DNA helicase